MSEILLRVKDTRLTLVSPARITGTQVEYNICKFDFGPEWADFVKTAVFRTGDKTINMVLDEEDKCNVPWESVAEKGVLYVGVFGTRDGVVIPTNFVTLNIVEGSAGNHVPAPPSLDVYMQIMQEMGDTRDYIDAMEAAIVSKEQARQDEYTEAEADRNSRYNEAEGTRNEAYGEAENQRDSRYAQEKSARNNAYNGAEGTRNNSYEIAEASRNRQYDEAEEARDGLYDERENSRDDLYEAAEAQRDTEYELEEIERNSAYEQAEGARDDEYEAEEMLRNGKYNTAEGTRNSLYEDAEEARDGLYEDAEADRDSRYEEAEEDRDSRLTAVEDAVGDIDELDVGETDNLVGAVNEVASDLAAHKAEKMPHQFTNLQTGKTYRFGRQVSAEGIPQRIYEEVIE